MQRSMKTVRNIELLSPAKNLECGIEAILHGADAVYIGAPKFGARATAGNSIEDISLLVQHAHLYNAKVYVTLNTILYEHELKETEALIWQLYHIGVDAIIIQDMGIWQMNLPPIAIHASTQIDTRTPEKVAFLQETGFQQIVLARELTLEEISSIHQQVPAATLEVFVHGALCVSYSGQCYVSHYNTQRSANRGECAQFCRLSFDMIDAMGNIIAKDKHLLSLKDMNRSEHLEALMDAGVSSFKIEGRLKDVSYVKNVTAHYRKELDKIIDRRPTYKRASSGSVTYSFAPQLDKTFSRGFTPFYLGGRRKDVTSFDTPKSLGEEMGVVKEIGRNYFTVAGVKSFQNGDGLCFLDEQGKLRGFRLNKVENGKLYPAEMPPLNPRTTIYRNFSQDFERIITKKTAERKISIEMILTENNFGVSLTLIDEDQNKITINVPIKKEVARTPQQENIKQQLLKLGNTPFVAESLKIAWEEEIFIPSSLLAEMRRNAVDKLLQLRKINYKREIVKNRPTDHPYITKQLTYQGNVMNSAARAFYAAHGVKEIAPAFELEAPADADLMSCKHCLRYSMGWCPTHQKGKSPYKEPYYLVSKDQKRYRLVFDCKACIMKLVASEYEA